MLQYVIAGLVLGGIYAIASAGLVITYVSSGILNFAFGALAFFVARFYYYLHTQEGWGIPYAALVSIVVAGPALGVLLYFLLFRHLRLSSPLVKVVATLGLLVAIPALTHPDLRQPGHFVCSGPGTTAGPGLQLHRRGCDIGPGHRLYLRPGHGHPRLGGAALHRRRPEGPGAGRLAGHDGPIGNQPECRLHRRLGREHVLRRLGGRAGRPHHRTGLGQLHPPHRGRLCGGHRRAVPQPAHCRQRGSAHGRRDVTHPALSAAVE